MLGQLLDEWQALNAAISASLGTNGRTKAAESSDVGSGNASG
jgi:hypothetical protein